MALFAVVALSLAWRLPSFFDPPWVNDEGTYYAVGRALAHGSRLYAGIWENKPPAIYLLYGAVYQLFGPSLLAIRLLSAMAVGLIILLVYRIGHDYVSKAAALAAALLTGLLMAVPFLEGTTANAEVFVALLATLGVYLSLVQKAHFAGGLALGCSILFKVVGAFDASALGLWLAAGPLRPRIQTPANPPRGKWRAPLWRYCFGLSLVVATFLVVSYRTGTLNGLWRDGVLYDIGYVGHTNGSGLPWLPAVKLLALLALSRALLLRASGEPFLRRRSSCRRASLAVRIDEPARLTGHRRWVFRQQSQLPFPYLWLLYAAAGTFFSGRLFGHYFIQMIAPLSLSLVIALHGRLPWKQVLVRLPLGYVSIAAVMAGVGLFLAASGHDSIFARRLQYYANFARYILQTESATEYRSQIDDQVNRNLALASDLRAMPAGRLLVWGNDPWLYVLSDRLPATRFTSVSRQPSIPGEKAALRRAVKQGRASEIVAFFPSPQPSIGVVRNALLAGYRSAFSFRGGRVYVARRFSAEPALAKVIASTRSGTK